MHLKLHFLVTLLRSKLQKQLVYCGFSENCFLKNSQEFAQFDKGFLSLKANWWAVLCFHYEDLTENWNMLSSIEFAWAFRQGKRQANWMILSISIFDSKVLRWSDQSQIIGKLCSLTLLRNLLRTFNSTKIRFLSSRRGVYVDRSG